ncbi:RNA polymerase sigma factor SigJ [Streptomyces sp. NPDC008150]|uniref:RNA polymerase sigma factor SigJ n=1 Tax=Streptomyces sp. NPDC008150 TaxID=3364816 RepID=UPI0036E6F31A
MSGEQRPGARVPGAGPGHPPAPGGEPELGVVMGERRRLVNLAYRLLGSLTEAEDVVQETYARWYATSPAQRAAVASPGAWLTTVASRVCLDQLRSARARREAYVGEWIPEPVPERAEWIHGWSGGGGTDPADRATLDESISMAFLVVLEQMTPAQRVAFVLHDVFRFSFAEVAGIVGRTPAACRQLASAARRRVRESREGATPDAQHPDVVRDFKAAWEAKDLDALIGLLDPDATATGDGGGVVRAALVPVRGAEEVARRAVGLLDVLPGLTLVERTVNGRPGLVVRRHSATVAVVAIAIVDGRIKHMWTVRNPEKLRPWTEDDGLG